MLAWGLNIVVGLAGLLDLGYVAFYAVGAYSYALLAISRYGISAWSFWILLPLAGILAAFWGMILGFPVLRLRGDYLAIVTLAFGEIIRLVLINWTRSHQRCCRHLRHPEGRASSACRSRLRRTTFAKVFGLPSRRLLQDLPLLPHPGAGAADRLRHHAPAPLPVGRAWEALREDEIACRSLGINTTNTKLTAFAIGAMFGGFAGSFFAARQGFVSPESFVFMESAIILAIVVLGGMGSLDRHRGRGRSR
jgi:branched-chain amino acid transport system permease protein